MERKMIYAKQELMAEALGLNAALYEQNETSIFELLKNQESLRTLKAQLAGRL